MPQVHQWIRRHSWWGTTIEGGISIIVGSLALVWPRATLTVFIGLIGTYAVVSGLLGLVTAVGEIAHPDPFWGQFARSMLSIYGGFLLWKWPAPTVAIVILIVAGWAISTGTLGATLTAIVPALRHTWLSVLAWVVTLVFGLLLLFWPHLGFQAVIRLGGSYALIHGIILGIAALRIRQQTTPVGTTSSTYA